MPSSRVVASSGALLLAALTVGCAAASEHVAAGGGGTGLGSSRPLAGAPAHPSASPAVATTVAATPEVAAAPPPTAAPPPITAATPPPAPAATAPPPATAATPPPAPSLGAAPAGTWFDSAGEWEFLALTNAERDRIGVPVLERDAALDAYARSHAAAMLAAGKIHHSPIANLLGTWWTVGENVGVGPTVQPIQDALLASPSHYENIALAEYRAMGLAVLADGTGRIWTVHVFAA